MRDGRAISLSAIVGLLLVLALSTGLSNERTKEQRIFQAKMADAEAFNAQGEKNPHSAAHFSRMAHHLSRRLICASQRFWGKLFGWKRITETRRCSERQKTHQS